MSKWLERNLLVSPMALFLEGPVRQEVHERRARVARHESLTEVAREIVEGGLGFGFGDAADSVRKGPFHVEARECGEDALHLVRRDLVVLEPAEVESDPSRGQ